MGRHWDGNNNQDRARNLLGGECGSGATPYSVIPAAIPAHYRLLSSGSPPPRRIPMAIGFGLRPAPVKAVFDQTARRATRSRSAFRTPPRQPGKGVGELMHDKDLARIAIACVLR